MNNLYECPRCDGEKGTLAFVCGENTGGLRMMPCQLCNATGQLTGEQLAAYHEQEAKMKQRREYRLSLNLTVREMAQKMGMSFRDYNDYEHGRKD